jgi:hypothetical protein
MLHHPLVQHRGAADRSDAVNARLFEMNIDAILVRCNDGASH